MIVSFALKYADIRKKKKNKLYSTFRKIQLIYFIFRNHYFKFYSL